MAAEADRDPMRAARLLQATITEDESVFGPDDRIRVSDTTAEPWRWIGKVTVTAEAGVFTGTGFLVGPFHMLTAGHVVHAAALGGDLWAQSLTVAFGKDGSFEPFARAEAVDIRAPAAWTASADPDDDWALVTLDRSIGAATGYFDLASNPAADFYDDSPVTIAGYPGDLSGGGAQYASAGVIGLGTADRFSYNGTLDTAGGMSGAPIWQSFLGSGTRQAIGVHTSGVADPNAPGAANGGTRLTAEKIGRIEEWMGQDAVLAPPVDLPDLADADAAFGTETAEVSKATLAAGEAFSLALSLANIGTAALTGGEVAVYASTNTAITEFDTILGTAAIPALSPFETQAVSVDLAVPSGLPAGFYHVGWLLAAPETQAEFDTANNSGLLGRSIEVSARPDLVAESLVVDTTAWTAGQTVSFAWSVRNVGGAAAPPAPSGIYLSTDPLVTVEDERLDTDHVGTLLGPGQSSAEGQGSGYTVSANFESGTYYIAAIADPVGEMDEADEANNASQPIEIRIFAPGVGLTGTAGPDLLDGGFSDDTLIGLGGDDTLRGSDGADLIEGGGDHDRIFGQDEPDTLIGGPGLDTILGQNGDDRIEGDLGDRVAGQADVLNGGPGADSLYGEGGPDTLFGEDGDDRLEGGPGIDQLNGNAGNDTLDGGDKRDTVDGAAGDDSLIGGEGNDLVFGGAGDDTIFTGLGPDFVDGEDGDDFVDAGADDDIVLGNAGADTLLGGPGADTIRAGGEVDSVDGGDGADRIYGEAGGDSIDGGAGDDFLNGNEGDDTIDGGAGDDTLRGGDGADLLLGGDGADAIAGRLGDDTLDGGAGNDALDGEQGDDRVDGGAGDDALRGKAGHDNLSGGAGDDSVFGGNDDDTLAGGPGADRIAGEAGVDRFVFLAGDGADLVFDFQPGVELLLLVGGVSSFSALDFGTSGDGWLTVGYSADPGDTITLQGVPPGGLADDGSVEFA